MDCSSPPAQIPSAFTWKLALRRSIAYMIKAAGERLRWSSASLSCDAYAGIGCTAAQRTMFRAASWDNSRARQAILKARWRSHDPSKADLLTHEAGDKGPSISRSTPKIQDRCRSSSGSARRNTGVRCLCDNQVHASGKVCRRSWTFTRRSRSFDYLLGAACASRSPAGRAPQG